MGRAGRERVEKYFSVERMVQKTEALYEELIGEKMERGGRRREGGRGKVERGKWKGEDEAARVCWGGDVDFRWRAVEAGEGRREEVDSFASGS